MKWKGINFAFVLRYVLTVSIGYLAVYVFILSFVAASQAKERLGLSTPLSEVTALVIATIITMPIVIPFVWKRLSKVKIGELEINLSEVSAKVKLTLADELGDVQRLAMGPSALPNLIEKLAIAISEAETSNIVEVEFGIGKPPWWSTRLYLLAALAKDYTDIHQLIFLESQQDRDRIYVGSATPDKICQALAVDNAKLVKAYHAAKKIPAPEHDAEVPEKRVAWIAQNFVWQFSEYGGEEQVKEFVTRKSLERYLPIIGNTLEWNGDPPTTLLIYQIVSRPELYVALIRNNGQLNLVVDRLKLAEHVSKITLRQQLE